MPHSEEYKKKWDAVEEYYLAIEALEQAVETLKAIRKTFSKEEITGEFHIYKPVEAGKALFIRYAIGSFLSHIEPLLLDEDDDDEEDEGDCDIKPLETQWKRGFSDDPVWQAPIGKFECHTIVPTVTKWSELDEKTKQRLLSNPGSRLTYSYEKNGVQITEEIVMFDYDKE